MEVLYDDSIVGQFYSDLIVNDLIILELKASKDIAQEHEAQLINYLKASEIKVGLLLNFGSTPKILRRVFTNDKKILNSFKEDEYDDFIDNRENL
jgi:GxxExxY protein